MLMVLPYPTVCLYVYVEAFLRLVNYLTKTGKDLERARSAFTLISQSRRLPALLENFLDTFARKLSNTQLSDPTFIKGYAEELLNEINEYITHFEVCRFITAVTSSAETHTRSASHQRSWRNSYHVWWNGIKRGHLLKSERVSWPTPFQ